MFVEVENGVVTRTITRIPRVHTFADGSRTGNFDQVDPAVQRAEGFYPLVDPATPYNADTQRIERTGYSVGSEEVTVTYNVVDIPLAELIAARSAEVEELLQEKLAQSQFDFNGQTFNFTPATAMDAAEFASVLATGFPFPASFSWTAADGTEVVMTASDFTAFGQTVAAHKLTLVGTAKAHVSNLKQLGHAETVVGYDITLGW